MVAVHLVGRHEEERRLGAVSARRFQEDQRGAGIHVEVGEWRAGSPIVRGLRRGVDDESDRLAVAGKEGLDRAFVADIERGVGVAGHLALQAGAAPGGRGVRPKEEGAQVVIDAHHLETEAGEVAGRLRANQARRARDNGNRHPNPQTKTVERYPRVARAPLSAAEHRP